MDLKKIKKMGKTAVIRLAEDEIKKRIDPDFQSKNFDRIKVFSGSNEVLVSFASSARYIPWQSGFLYDITIIFGKELMLSYGPVHNPENYKEKEKPVFFKITPESWEALDFVMDAVNRSKEAGPLPDKKIPEGSVMTVFERKGHYEVLMLSKHTESFYKVDRRTGKIYDASHNHLEAGPEEKGERYQEIR